MHIIHNLTQMPVSVVIKALKWRIYRRGGYTEFVCRVVVCPRQGVVLI